MGSLRNRFHRFASFDIRGLFDSPMELFELPHCQLHTFFAISNAFKIAGKYHAEAIFRTKAISF